MEVVVAVAPPSPPPPATAVDFNFDSNCSSPYITAPSSPQRFGNLIFSAPTSPTRVSTFLHQLNHFPTTTTTTTSHSSSPSSIPFHWEQQPGVPKPQHNKSHSSNEFDDGFEFNFSGHLEPSSLSAADELFDGGKIKPLKPPPRLHLGDGITSPRSPKKGKKIFSPRHNNNQKRDFDSDPFALALEETRRREEQQPQPQQQKRGRERVSSSSSSSSSLSSSYGRKGTRSLSPFRVSDIMYETEDKVVSSTTSNTKPSSSSYVSFLSSIPFTKGYRKWRLKDLLLFRSASEGRATDKDPLRNYDVLSNSKKTITVEEDVRNSSFRSTESSGSVSKRRGPVSAHELHYTMNRAASEELKKKTLLPYKQGLLGCLGFNPGMNQISRGIGSSFSSSRS